MHISIGAAILILGLLYLATTPAGRKVLGVVFVLIVVGGGGIFAWLVQQENAQADQRDTKEAYLTAHHAEMQVRCYQKYPDPLRDGALSYRWRGWSDCMSGKGEDLSKEIDAWRATVKDPVAAACEEYNRSSAPYYSSLASRCEAIAKEPTGSNRY
jgi:hypothetical protein